MQEHANNSSNHENVHTITQNSNSMDIKRNGMDSNCTDIFYVFHVNNMLISSDTVHSMEK